MLGLVTMNFAVPICSLM